MEEEAFAFAEEAHEGQQRRYKNEPYIEHPKRVAKIVKTVPHTPQMVCAAYLHDVVEDTPVSLQDIENKFGKTVAKLVEELTDEYEKEKYPHLNRKKRKQKETQRQTTISNEAKTIKLADVIDNTPDIFENDPGFARRYILEMEALTEALVGGAFPLLMRACYEVQRAKYALQHNKK